MLCSCHKTEEILRRETILPHVGDGHAIHCLVCVNVSLFELDSVGRTSATLSQVNDVLCFFLVTRCIGDAAWLTSIPKSDDGCSEVTEEKVAEIQTESEKYMVASLHIYICIYCKRLR